MLNQVISLAESITTKSIVFLTVIYQINYITVLLIKNISNKIGNLKLKSFPGENILKLGETITEKIGQIEESDNKPVDLLTLVFKLYTTGTQETFRIFAQQIYTAILDRSFQDKYIDII